MRRGRCSGEIDGCQFYSYSFYYNDLERVTFNLIQIEGDPRHASLWSCCLQPLVVLLAAFDRVNPIKGDTL
jgi:hypothetical protein